MINSDERNQQVRAKNEIEIWQHWANNWKDHGLLALRERIPTKINSKPHKCSHISHDYFDCFDYLVKQFFVRFWTPFRVVQNSEPCF